MQNPTLFIRIQSIYVRCAIVPLEIVLELAQLGLDDVEVAAVGPVVPEVHHLEISGAVHEED